MPLPPPNEEGVEVADEGEDADSGDEESISANCASSSALRLRRDGVVRLTDRPLAKLSLRILSSGLSDGDGRRSGDGRAEPGEGGGCRIVWARPFIGWRSADPAATAAGPYVLRTLPAKKYSWDVAPAVACSVASCPLVARCRPSAEAVAA